MDGHALEYPAAAARPGARADRGASRLGDVKDSGDARGREVGVGPPGDDPGEVDLEALRHHGDREVAGAHAGGEGLLDFAVNVHGAGPPAWLRRRLEARLDDLGAYPAEADHGRATEALARRHGVGDDAVLPLAGSAEGFHLLARLAARRGGVAAVVHPSFTEPELELRSAGVPVRRVVLDPPFELDPELVPAEASMVVVGNPTNPTSVVHARERLAALCAPGRVTVVDEAFCDVVSGGDAHSLAGSGLPGLVVLRSLTKTWALAGLRVGYAVGDPAVLAALSPLRPHWPVGTLQFEALVACTSPEADADLARIRETIAARRGEMVRRLGAAGVEIVTDPAAPFVLVRTPGEVDPVAFRESLLRRGVVVRRGDTFPGLDATHLRLAVRDGTMVGRLLDAWAAADRDPGRPAPIHRDPEQEPR